MFLPAHRFSRLIPTFVLLAVALLTLPGAARAGVTGTISSTPVGTFSGRVVLEGTAESTGGSVQEVRVSYGLGSICTNPTPKSPWACEWQTTNAPDGAYTIVLEVVDSTGSAAQIIRSVTVDNTAPTGGSVTYSNAITPDSSASVTFAGGSDTGSGMGSLQLQRRAGTYSANLCSAHSAWTNVGPVNPASPYTDATIADGFCYQYRLIAKDNASNSTIYAHPNEVKVDRSTSLPPVKTGGTTTGGTTTGETTTGETTTGGTTTGGTTTGGTTTGGTTTGGTTTGGTTTGGTTTGGTTTGGTTTPNPNPVPVKSTCYNKNKRLATAFGETSGPDIVSNAYIYVMAGARKSPGKHGVDFAKMQAFGQFLKHDNPYWWKCGVEGRASGAKLYLEAFGKSAEPDLELPRCIPKKNKYDVFGLFPDCTARDKEIKNEIKAWRRFSQTGDGAEPKPRTKDMEILVSELNRFHPANNIDHNLRAEAKISHLTNAGAEVKAIVKDMPSMYQCASTRSLRGLKPDLNAALGALFIPSSKDGSSTFIERVEAKIGASLTAGHPCFTVAKYALGTLK